MKTTNPSKNILSPILSKQEIQEFCKISPWKSSFAILKTWLAILGIFVVLYFWAHPMTYVLGIILLGGQQLALVILVHEASHKLLFQSKKWNDLIGNWVCGYPLWFSLKHYRQEHLQHHWKTGTSEDPDLGLVRPYPTSKRSMLRKILRDLSGITGLKRLLALVMMDFGFLSYSYSTNSKKIPREKSFFHHFSHGIVNSFPYLFTNALLFLLFWATGRPLLYLIWFISYLTTYSFYIRLRSIAEHACTPNLEDPLNNTRTTKAGLIAQLLIAPHHVNYHLEHHLLQSVPHYRLRKLHHLLQQRGLLENACCEKTYRKIFSSAVI